MFQEFGYVLVFKPVLPPKQGGKPKGNVGADLVLQAMIDYPNYKEVAVIVISDGDFYCLVSTSTSPSSAD